ncbi:MAG: DUF4224 domain-containing protein [Hahellaceae bacterium]|nr:DUF4224 domain-containing protein [Hahellaceae bacterium]
MSIELLSADDLVNLTGAKIPSKQSAVLDRNGIYYITRLDGTIITTWHHVNHPAMQRAANHDEPDFSKVS